MRFRVSNPYCWPTLKSSTPWSGAVCTAPVPASVFTCPPRIRGTCLFANGCCNKKFSRLAPVVSASSWNFSQPYRAITSSAMSLASKTVSTPNPNSQRANTYTNSACRQTAWFEGNVQGVVVQITTDNCSVVSAISIPSKACRKVWGSATEKRTSMAEEILSLYSTSASASAEAPTTLQ